MLVFALFCSGCERGGGGSEERPSATIAEGVSSVESVGVTSAATTVGADGIGAARAGMTLGELRTQLPPELRLGKLDQQFMVDLAAVPVHSERDTLYYLVFPAGEEVSDSTRLTLVVTDHDRIRTAEGVGPGTTLADAARHYGNPRLGYSVHDEMREYASFPRSPYPRVRFRVAPSDTALLAGRYATSAEYNEATVFDEAARIGMVFVDLGPGGAP